MYASWDIMYANYIPSAASGFAGCQLKTSEGSSGEFACCKHRNINFCEIHISSQFVYSKTHQLVNQ